MANSNSINRVGDEIINKVKIEIENEKEKIVQTENGKDKIGEKEESCSSEKRLEDEGDIQCNKKILLKSLS